MEDTDNNEYEIEMEYEDEINQIESADDFVGLIAGRIMRN
jgi:hypothetical protein